MVENARRLLISLVVALCLAWGGPALAQSAEAEQLGVKIAHELISAMDFNAAVMKGARESAKSMGGLDEYRPNWSKLALQALEEEVAASGPLMERIIGHRIALNFTLEELQAGAVIMSDPAVKAMVGAASRREELGDFSCGPECTRTATSRAGRSFLRKFQHADEFLDREAQGDLIAAIVPGFLRRLADKIDASEKASGR